jgi:hypothetical protein
MNIEEIRKLVPDGGREVRVVSGGLEIRAEDDGQPGWALAGHAAVFDQETVIWNMWRESIAPGAFDDVLDDDVRHLINHDPNLVMARTKSGTLSLEQDEVGLAYEAQLNPNDPDAVSAREKVLRGDVDQSSFAFIVAESSWEDEDADDGTLPHRRITKMSRLYDTSTVTYPAYEGADSGIRSAAIDALGSAQGLDASVKLRLLRAFEEAGDDVATLLSAISEFERVVREAQQGPEDGGDPDPAEAGPEGGEPDEGAAVDGAPAEPGPADEDDAEDDVAEPTPEGDDDGPTESEAERFEREATERRHARRQALMTTKE